MQTMSEVNAVARLSAAGQTRRARGNSVRLSCSEKRRNESLRIDKPGSRELQTNNREANSRSDVTQAEGKPWRAMAFY